MRQFRDKIQQQITRQHLPVAEVARRAGIARPYLHRIIAGKQVPTLERAERLANAVGLAIKIVKMPVDK